MSAVSVDDALKSFREMMATDGYLLTWSEAGSDKVVVKIAATGDPQGTDRRVA